jgi:flagellin
MSLRINHNLAAVVGHYHLVSTDRMQALVTQRLTSGVRIDKAGDDPTGMMLANALQHHYRAAIQATNNAEDGVSMLQTAEASLDEGHRLLNRMRELAIQGGNAGTLDAAQLEALQAEFDNSVAALDRIATSTRFGSTYLLRGDFANNTLSTTAQTYYQSVDFDATKLPGGVQAGSTISIGAPSADLTHESVSVTMDTDLLAGNGFAARTDTISGLFQNGTQLTVAADTTVTVSGPLGSKDIIVTPVTTISDFVGLVNASTEVTGARASYDSATGQLAVESKNFGSGAVSISGADLSGGSSIGLMDTDTTSATSNPLEAARDVFAMDLFNAGFPAVITDPIQGLDDNVSGEILDEVDGKQFRIFGAGNSATLDLTATTTIQDVVDFVNANTADTGARAQYDALTGTLSVIGGRGSLMVSSDDMTSAASTAGLLDLDTNTINSTGATQTSTAGNPTLDITFVDANGTTQTVTLTQDVTTADGLSFVNLTPGPELFAPYSGWETGGIRVTLDDTTDGSVGSTLTVATAAQTATRKSTRFLQTGGATSTKNFVEIRDMRVAALGATAFQQEFASLDPVKPLVTNGFHSLQDLVDSGALSNGFSSEALALIDGAIAEMNESRGTLGALQSHSIEAAMNALRVTSENLLSAESQIRDTDFAIESASFTKNNILMQATTAMLAQANQVPNRLLQLLTR